MNGGVNESPGAELTSCSQVWPSPVLLHSTYYNIWSKLPTLIHLEVFYGGCWVHVGKKFFLQDLATLGHLPTPSHPFPPPPLRASICWSSHGGLL